MISTAVDKKLIAVMGGGLVLGGGVFAWYVLYGDRMVARDAAKKPIEQWEEAWHHTRTCLLGDHPRYADVGDELAVRAFEGQLEACSLKDVGPPDMPGTGIDEIEDAWEQVRTGWHDLSVAQPYADRDAAAVRELDAAEAKLREGAGLDPLPAGPTGVLATLALSGTAKVTADRLTPRAHALTGIGSAGWVTARGATDVALQAPSEADRAWPDPSWGALVNAPDDASDRGGATDDEPKAAPQLATVTSGAIGADGRLHDEVIVAKGQFTGIAAAVGTGAERTIVLRAGTPEVSSGLVSARSTDGGAHWSKPESIAGTWIEAPWQWPGDPPVFIDPAEDGASALLFLDAHGATTRVDSPMPLVGAHACTAGGTIWSVTGEQLVRIAPGQPPTPIETPEGGDPIACTADAVALRTNDQVFRCSRAACDRGVDVPGSSEGFADVFDGGGVMFAMQRDQIVGVWRNGVDPTFSRAPAGATLVGAVVWGKSPTLAFTTDAGLRFAAIP